MRELAIAGASRSAITSRRGLSKTGKKKGLYIGIRLVAAPSLCVQWWLRNWYSRGIEDLGQSEEHDSSEALDYWSISNLKHFVFEPIAETYLYL